MEPAPSIPFLPPLLQECLVGRVSLPKNTSKVKMKDVPQDEQIPGYTFNVSVNKDKDPNDGKVKKYIEVGLPGAPQALVFCLRNCKNCTDDDNKMYSIGHCTSECKTWEEQAFEIYRQVVKTHAKTPVRAPVPASATPPAVAAGPTGVPAPEDDVSLDDEAEDGDPVRGKVKAFFDLVFQQDCENVQIYVGLAGLGDCVTFDTKNGTHQVYAWLTECPSFVIAKDFDVDMYVFRSDKKRVSYKFDHKKGTSHVNIDALRGAPDEALTPLTLTPSTPVRSIL